MLLSSPRSSFRATGFALLASVAVASAQTMFDYLDPVPIPPFGEAAPYPVVLEVSGVAAGYRLNIVGLWALSQDYLPDLAVVLVAPTGEQLTLMSGITGRTLWNDMDDQNVFFTNLAGVSASSGMSSGGFYRPYGREEGLSLPELGIIPTGAQSFDVFNATNPNGEWKLYIYNGDTNFGGVVDEGFSLTFGVPDAFYWMGDSNASWNDLNWVLDKEGYFYTNSFPAWEEEPVNVVFAANGAGNLTNTMGGNQTVRGLYIEAAQPVTINPGGNYQLTLEGEAGTGIHVAQGAGAFTLNARLRFRGASNTIRVENAAGATLNGAITGSNGLVKSGTGDLVLTSTASHTGGTRVEGGWLRISGGLSHAADDVWVGIAEGGSAGLAITGTASVRRVVIGEGGGGALSISDYGSLDVGSIVRGSGTGPVAVDFREAFLYASESTEHFLSGFQPGEVVITHYLAVDTRGYDVAMGSPVGGGGSLAKTGMGVLTLSASNHFAGAILVSNGVLRAGAEHAFPRVAYDVGSTATIDLNGFDTEMTRMTGHGTFALGSATLTLDQAGFEVFSGELSGPGSFRLQGGGDLEVEGKLAHTGATEIESGRILYLGAGAIATEGRLHLGVGGELHLLNRWGAPFTLHNVSFGSLSGAGQVVSGVNTFSYFTWGNDGSDTTFSGSLQLTGLATKTGPGVTTLSGNSSLSDLLISGGAVRLEGAASLGANVAISLIGDAAAPPVLDLNGVDLALRVLNGNAAAHVALGSGTLTLNHPGNQDITFSGRISGSGGIVKNGGGRLVLNGAHTFTGPATVASGTLQLGNAVADGRLVGEVLNHGVLAIANTGQWSYGGVISGSGSLSHLGGETLFSGTHTYTGPTTVTGGRLVVDGALASPVEVHNGATLGGSGFVSAAVLHAGAALAPGSSPGTFTVGALSLDAATFLDFELNGPNAPGGSNDLVNVTGELGLAGILRLEVGSGFTTGVYTLFTYGTLGASHPLTLGIVPAGYTFSLDLSAPGEVRLLADYTGLQFWNGAHASADGTIYGGSGTWDAATANWVNEDATLHHPWAGLSAVFSGSAGEVQIVGSHVVEGLQFQSDGYTLSGGELVFTGAQGEVRVDGGLSAEIGTSLSGSGGLLKTGSGAVVLSGSNSYSGGTAIAGGTVQVAHDAALGAASGALHFLGGTLHTTASFESARAVELTYLGRFEVGGGTVLTLSGTVAGGGGLTKAGEGALVLVNDALHTGATHIRAGRLESASLAGSAVYLHEGGVFSPGGEAAAQITVGGLVLGGGDFRFQLGGDHIGVADGAAALLAATRFVFGAGPVGNGLYPLITGVGEGWDTALLSYTGFDPALGSFLLSEGGLFLNVYDGSPVGGAVIQNSAPVGTPRDARFLVQGAVSTGREGESNTIASLVFEPGGSVAISNTLTLTSGSIHLAGGTAALGGGIVATPGGYTQSGSGTLVFGSRAHIGGVAAVESGALLINEVFETASGVWVAPGAWLGGSGAVVGSVANAGTLAPGNSPGTFTIVGDYAQSGALEVEVASTTVYDRLVVTGNATLAGTLAVVEYGSHRLAYGQKVPFLQARKIEGDFAQIEMPRASLRGRFLTEQRGTVGTLLVAPASYTQVAKTPNQKQAAKALDAFIPATRGDRLTVSLALDHLSEAQYPAAFDQIAPTFHEYVLRATLEEANARHQRLSQRLGAVRAGASGFQAINLDAPATLERGDGEASALLVPAPENRWGVWTQGYGMLAKVPGLSEIPSHRARSGGFLVGADYRWGGSLATGFYTGYESACSRSLSNGRYARKSALFGAYATFHHGGFYGNATLGGGRSEYDIRRPIAFGSVERTARSRPDGAEWSAALDLGHDWQARGFTFGPVGSLQYTRAGVEALGETGAQSLDLQLGHQRARSLRSSLGARVAYTWQAGGGVSFTPELRLLWQHEFLNDARTLNAVLDGGPGFTYLTSSPGRDSAFAGAGVSARFGPRWSGWVYYNADFGRGATSSQMVSGGLGVQF